MPSEVEINGRVRQVSVHRTGRRFMVMMDGREWSVDAARVDAHTVSLLMSEGRAHGEIQAKPGARSGPRADADQGRRPGFSRTLSHEVTIHPTSARGRLDVSVGQTALVASLGGLRRLGLRDDPTDADLAPSRVLAPMPGKVVRLLVKPGETVRARQPVVVVEAMKMENELGATRGGIVIAIPVEVGQLVEVGAVLAIVGDGGPWES